MKLLMTCSIGVFDIYTKDIGVGICAPRSRNVMFEHSYSDSDSERESLYIQ